MLPGYPNHKHAIIKLMHTRSDKHTHHIASAHITKHTHHTQWHHIAQTLDLTSTYTRLSKRQPLPNDHPTPTYKVLVGTWQWPSVPPARTCPHLTLGALENPHSISESFEVCPFLLRLSQKVLQQFWSHQQARSCPAGQGTQHCTCVWVWSG